MRYFLRFLIKVVIKSVARVEVIGREYLPAYWPAVNEKSKTSYERHITAYYALNRWDLFILVAEKWGEIGWIKWLGKQLSFIFIDRYNPDLPAMREIIKRMKQGQVLVIAPEGTRSKTGGLIEGKQGVSFLAAKAGYPIIPVAITGTEDKVILGNLKKLKRSPVTITGGPTFTLPSLPKKGRDKMLIQYTDEIMCRIAQILPVRYRGIYTNHPRLKELVQTKDKR